MPGAHLRYAPALCLLAVPIDELGEHVPNKKGRVTATLAAKSVVELSSSRAIRDRVSGLHRVLGTAFISNRPARAAERAPKGLKTRGALAFQAAT